MNGGMRASSSSTPLLVSNFFMCTGWRKSKREHGAHWCSQSQSHFVIAMSTLGLLLLRNNKCSLEWFLASCVFNLNSKNPKPWLWSNLLQASGEALLTSSSAIRMSTCLSSNNSADGLLWSKQNLAFERKLLKISSSKSVTSISR